MSSKTKDPLVELSNRLRGEKVTDGFYDKRLYNTLKGAYEENKLHHAHLILGIGKLVKFNTIRRLAAKMVCQSPTPEGEPCGECNACKTVFAGTHPGFRVISPSGASITINQIRELKEEAYRKTSYPKVFIITEAQKMTYPAVSAMLKVLEEPPQNTFIFLFSPYPSLPPTIISRCVRERIEIDYNYLTTLLRDLVSEEEIRINLEIFGPDLELLEIALRDTILGGDSLSMRVALGDLIRFSDLEATLKIANLLQKNLKRNLKILLRLAGTLGSLILRLSSGYEDEADKLLTKAFSINKGELTPDLVNRAYNLIDTLKRIKPLEEEVEKFNSKLLSYGISLLLQKAVNQG